MKISRLLTISYGLPNPNPSSVPATAGVSFSYDNTGNRISMTDGLGTVSYAYNELSQLVSETRAFTDALADAPLAGNSFKLEYDYTLSGGLKSLKDPYGQQINYSYDKIGRLNSVAGAAAFGGITTYASNPQYRAWGGLKSLSYGNQTQMSMTFNNRLQANHYEFNKTGQTPPVMSKNYEYYADGSLRKLDDAIDDRFDRLNTYDNLGRPKTGKSGAEARGGTVAQADMETQLPYRQSYSYNAFNNLTQRNNLHWGVESWQGQDNNLSYSYQNNRIVDQYNSRLYDADGRMLSSSRTTDDGGVYTHDARGQLTKFIAGDSSREIYRYYNGEGREAKRNKRTDTTGNGNWVDEIKYYIRSSVLGGEVVTEADVTGRKLKTIVRAAGATLAWQTVYRWNNTDQEYVNFEQWDASAMSYRSTTNDGSAIYGEGAEGSPAEFDPLGSNVGLSSPYYTEPPPPVEPEYPSLQNLYGESPMYVNGQRVTATLDGMEVSLSFALSALSSGSAVQCPNNYCGAQTAVNSLGQTVITSPFQAFADGRSGYNVPVWTRVNVLDNNGNLETLGEREFAGWIFREVSYSNASWSWGQQRDRKITKQEIEEIRGQLSTALDSNKSSNGIKCRDFLKEALRILRANYKDIMTVYDAYGKKGAIYDIPGSTGRAEFPASSRRSRLEIDLKKTDELVLTFFHELLHGAGTAKSFNHTDIGRAMYQAGRNLGFMSERKFFKGDPEKLSSSDENVVYHEESRVESQYYNAGEDALKAACAGL